MEIKIEETEDSLKIIKSCKKELKWSFIIGIICNICIIYPILKITPVEYYFGFLIFYTPILLAILAFFCNKYSYEVIFISDKKIFFYQTYSLNILNTPNLSFFLSNLKNIYSKSYGGSIYFRTYDIRKLVVNIKNHPNLRVHFIFENEKLDYCAWGYEIPMEEAEEVVKKIKEFLKKRNNNELE
ncbi:hypothetical protein ACO1GU_00010 [Fusobacterium watanabei]|uniref:hypothetical protein n=1 Tax=Fusobacterium watanabei TaxID=2686067 RepID=UPI003B589EBE